MGASASRGRPARVPAPEPEPEEALDLSQLPPELLLVVLSHVPPRTLLGCCRRVCRGWRALVDGQALWLLILARDHGALLPLARSCLPPARDGRPCLLGRFCERRPIGRNLIRNPCGQEGLRKWMVQHGGDGWVVEVNRSTVPGAPSQTCFVSSFSWCRKKQVLDLEEEGLWPELLDSGKIEICVSDCLLQGKPNRHHPREVPNPDLLLFPGHGVRMHYCPVHPCDCIHGTLPTWEVRLSTRISVGASSCGSSQPPGQLMLPDVS
ncbi:F-box only protein 27 isoform X2 [Panthera tigris]|uniref:F-box only protein 27 isoform X2 n=1 Tax=Panthera tigris TaxID=9694 RepID=UPI001C6F7B0A|nr:F-box only protein 27 isoform X2 [Panthera tigris]